MSLDYAAISESSDDETELNPVMNTFIFLLFFFLLLFLAKFGLVDVETSKSNARFNKHF